MTEPSIIQKSFKGWKIWMAIALGLLVAGWMVYRSISEVHFLAVEKGNGNYAWVDFNKNGSVDLENSKEFYLSTDGEYRKQKLSDVLLAITWTNQSFIWLIVAILFVVGRDFFYMWRIRLLTHYDLSWKSSFYVILLWEFASALSPGVVGGAAVAMFILHKEKIELGRATAIVFITAMMDNLFYVIMIPFVFLFIDSAQLFPSSIEGSMRIEWVFWIGFSAILLACLFLFSSIFLFPSLATWLLKSVFSLPVLRRWKAKAIQTGKDIETSSKVMRKESVGYWLKIFGLTCASWTSRYLVINAILQAFLQLGFIDHIVILGKQLVLWLFMLVSPTPGGSGVAEFAFGELLVSFSQSSLLLAALAILWRLISYFPYLFIGAFLLPRWLKKNN
jgi:uncharacterized protein (TIRG00374 family)